MTDAADSRTRIDVGADHLREGRQTGGVAGPVVSSVSIIRIRCAKVRTAVMNRTLEHDHTAAERWSHSTPGFWTVYTHTTQHFEMVLHRSLYSPLRGFVQNEAFQRVGLLHPRRAGKNLLRVLVTGPPACPNACRTEVDILGMVFSIESWRQQTHDMHQR